MTALIWGLLSAVSLPIGAALGLLARPTRRITSSFMAFGGGALLFALTIELFGHTLHAASEKHDPWIALSTVIGALLGGVLFELLNRALNSQGAFLRKQALAQRELEKSRMQDAGQMLKSLSEISFLQVLPPEEIASLIPYITTRHFGPGETVFQQGEPGLELFFILQGKVEVSRGSGSGQTTIAVLGAGDTFGEMALVSDQPRTATVKAVEPVDVFCLGKAEFVELLKRNTAMQVASRRIVIERLQGMSEKDESFRAAAIEWHARALEQFSRLPVIITDRDLARAAEGHKGGAALAIWLGIALDGIPESLIIGMLVTAAAVSGSPMSLAFIAGVFLANLPEAMSSAVTMQRQGKTFTSIMLMWLSLCVMTGLGAVAGASLFPAHPGGSLAYVVGGIEGIAAGAMLTMIANTMLPEAFEQGGGTIAGLSALAGFLCALGVKLIG